MEKILLIDGNSILNRAFYGLPDMTNSNGQHTNAVLGFIHILMKVVEEETPDYITVAFDRKEPTFRHEMYEEYKGNRKPMPEELAEQLPRIKEVLAAMKILYLEHAGWEADDILGSLAKKAETEGMKVVILSGDRDLLQMASSQIQIRIPKTKKGVTEVEDYYEEDVKTKYGVTPIQFIDMKALMGDSSDNIPGVPSIGEKTAAKIIQSFGSIENAYAHIEEIKPPKAQKMLKEHYHLAQLSKVLATIKTDCELEYKKEDAKKGNFFTKETYQVFQQLEFKSLIYRYFNKMDFSAEQAELTKEGTEQFILLEDFSEAGEIFRKAEKKKRVAVSGIAEDGTLLGLSLAFSEGQAYFIPIQFFMTEEYLLQCWHRLVQVSPNSIFLNIKENLPYLERADTWKGTETAVTEERKFDVGIAAYLLNPLKDAYGYEEVARDYLHRIVPGRSELLGKMSLKQAQEEKPEEFLKYCCFNSLIPFLAQPVLKERLEKQGMQKLFETVEMPLIFTLYRMEQWGIRANKEELQEYGKRLAIKIKEVEESIYRQVGEQFNINSPKQLGEILFEKMGLSGGKKTKTGYSTAAEVLEKLAPEYPVVREILEYRQYTKLKSTYADGLAAYIGADGRIHGKFNQTITATGRISSTEPNLQNIPVRMELGREIRKVFVPEPGYVFLDADYSQIELRVLAHMSGDQHLIEAYRDAEDIHSTTASKVFHVPLEEVTPLQRRNAKAVNFGIVYGISSFGLSQDLSVSKTEAQEYIEQYFQAYPGIKRFLDQLVTEAKEKGYSVTMFGRRRPLPEITSSNYTQRSFGERIAMNSPIQGTAADIIKIAMIRVERRLREQKLKSRLILQVHDELLIETHQEEVDIVSQILEEEMMHAADLQVKLEVDMHTGTSWFDAK